MTNEDAAREPASLAKRLRGGSQRLAARALGTTSRPLVVGSEHVPEGAVLIAVNHPTRSDRGLIEAALTDGGRRARPVWFTTLDDADDVERARRHLDADEAVVVFVEGHRSPDGAVHRARPELGVLVTGTEAPVVPAGVRPPVDRRGWLALSGAAGPAVEFAAPLDLARHRERSDDPIARQTASDTLVHAILRLAEREYVDADASVRRAELRRQAAADRLTRAEAARADRAAAERARAEALRAAQADAVRAADELAAAEQAAREHAANAAAADSARRDAVRAQKLARGVQHPPSDPRDPRLVRLPPQPTERE